MAPQRRVTRFPQVNRGFLGENNREGLTDELFAAGALYRCRNYHLVGRGRLQKRQGSTAYVATKVSGSNPVQNLMMYEWGASRHLLALSNGTLQRLNAGAWTGITGALTFTAGQDDRITTTHFHDGDGSWIIGTAPNNGRLWKWGGSGSAVVLMDDNTGPQYAADVVESFGRVWTINSINGPTIVEYSGDQMASDWPAGNYMHVSRESPGVGFSRHGNRGIVVFHQRSTHAIYFDATANTPWIVKPLDNRVGCISKDSIVYDRGITYWAASDGFYRLRSVTGPVEFIGHPMGDVWSGLNSTRRGMLTGFARGGTFSEIVWLASDNVSTYHDVPMVWNPILEGWTLFDTQTPSLAYNCGCDWTDSNGHHITLLGDTTGTVWAAWGDDEYDTGYRDGGESGSPVRSEVQTGFLDFGYPGIKRLREGWMDAVVNTNRSFDLEVVGLGEGEGEVGIGNIGVTGARLSVSFFLDRSRLSASDLPAPGQFQVSVRSRAFQFRLTEQSADKPHILNALWFWWLPRGARFNA